MYRGNSKRVLIVYLCLVSVSGTFSWERANRCGVCSQLDEEEFISQKVKRKYSTAYLPPCLGLYVNIRLLTCLVM